MAKKHTKKLTILHSNDLHGDFLAEHVDEKTGWRGIFIIRLYQQS